MIEVKIKAEPVDIVIIQVYMPTTKKYWIEPRERIM